MELVLKNIQGKKLGTVDFLQNFDYENINTTLIHEAVVNYLANQREGNASTKTRGEVSGGGKKPWKQKGTGRARAGSNRSPVWRGGGIIFGPQPKDYSYSMPIKKKRKALENALALKAKNENILVLDKIKKIEKTKQMATILNTLEMQGKTLLIVKSQDADLLKASRNISKLELVYADKVNTYDVMAFDNLIADKESIEFFNQKFDEGKVK